MSRPHILFVHANNSELGGADYCLFRLVVSLDSDRFRKSVLLREDTGIANLYRGAGIPVHVLPILRIKKPDRLVAVPVMLWRGIMSVLTIARFVREHSVDLVHSNDLLDLSSVLAARLSGRPSVQHIRLMVFKWFWLRRSVGWLLKCVNSHVICVSKAVRTWYLGSTPATGKASVLYDWVDFSSSKQDSESVELRVELGLPKATRLVGSVGRMEPSKGHDHFVQAAAKVAAAQPDVHFVVCGPKVCGRGREGYQSHLQALVLALGMGDKIHFLGERRGIKSIFEQLDIVAHCTIVPEAFGMVIAEALVCGCSVVAANCGGVPEQITEGVNGLLHAPGDADALASKILQLLRCPRQSDHQKLQAEIASQSLRETTLFALARIYQQSLGLFRN